MVDTRKIKIRECTICQRKVCEKSLNKVLDFCQLGVAYFNDNGNIIRSRERVTKFDIAANLRHELNRVLQYIINQAEEIDPNVSTRVINLNSAASRLVGATIILDQFIEMMCGVHQFHQIHTPKHSNDKRKLTDIIHKQMEMYSLIQNTRRARDLNYEIKVPETINIINQASKIEYLTAIFCDNIWKYADPEYPVKILVTKRDELVDLSFINTGKPIPEGADIFIEGEQIDRKSEGFGYGLAWAQVLTYQYNDDLGILETDSELKIEHEESKIQSGKCSHKFIIKNIAIG